jgi:uncharacterized protein YyaL (SSP411 family)
MASPGRKPKQQATNLHRQRGAAKKPTMHCPPQNSQKTIDRRANLPSRPSFCRPLLAAAIAAACGLTLFGQASTSSAQEAPATATTIADPQLPGTTADPALETSLREALAAKGPSYEPRCEHTDDAGAPQFVNRLLHETSPYLLQHAHNPVNWYPWSDEAFERARTEGKPVFLSVGYSTCHWCHVMEHESFEDIEIARFLNEHFIAIKVDREERPDVDDIYMKAVNIMAGRGGWPMTLMLTPDRKPFFAGTYFVARTGDRGARKGFLTILEEMSALYSENPEEALAKANEVSQRIRTAAAPARPGTIPGPQVIRRAAERFTQSFEPVWGGFGRSPKFPRPVELALMLRYWRRTDDAGALAMIEKTLDGMAAGGMYDLVGGGFHRYSTEMTWTVPHFEKMLYDNAQLVMAYLHGWQASGNPHYQRIARETLDYVVREMTAQEGAFFSATDADSPAPNGHREEGLFFTWTPAEVRELLDSEQANAVITRFKLTARGNFEGRSIPHTRETAEEVAKKLNIDVPTLEKHLTQAREKMYQARALRPPPLLDDKILVAWNGLMISAFAQAASTLDDTGYLHAGRKAARFVLDHVHDGSGRLLRSYKDGKARHRAYLEDYSFMIAALLDLFEADADQTWLEEAIRLQALLDKHYWDQKNGGYFTTAHDAEVLLSREKPSYDGAEPSGNSVAALNLLRLEEFTLDAKYRTKAEKVLGAFATVLERGSTSAPLLLSALDFYLDRPLEIVIISTEESVSSEQASALRDVLRKRFIPNRVVIDATQGEKLDALAKRIPLLEAKTARDGLTTAYVCEKGNCKFPTSDPEVFAKQLATVHPLIENSTPKPLTVPKPGPPPMPWAWDAPNNRHWHPGHKHWHQGPPPADKATSTD